MESVRSGLTVPFKITQQLLDWDQSLIVIANELRAVDCTLLSVIWFWLRDPSIYYYKFVIDFAALLATTIYTMSSMCCSLVPISWINTCLAIFYRLIISYSIISTMWFSANRDLNPKVNVRHSCLAPTVNVRHPLLVPKVKYFVVVPVICFHSEKFREQFQS